jgi:hypothetical protein
VTARGGMRRAPRKSSTKRDISFMTGVPHIAETIEHARTGALPDKEACVEAEATRAVMRFLQGAADGRKPDACLWFSSARRASITASSRRRGSSV